MSLFIFDKDGTLVSVPDPKIDRPANTPEEQVLLPGVASKIAALRAEGHTIAVASNQGGVAWEFITHEQAKALLDDCARKIGGAFTFFCPHDQRAAAAGRTNQYAIACQCRKPAPGLLVQAMNEAGYHPAQTIYVGDRDSDLEAATDAGVQFVWAKDFFSNAT